MIPSSQKTSIRSLRGAGVDGQSCSSEDRRSRRSAFTLVELLVVIAIIAILALLSMASLNKTQAKSRAVQCCANLRQIGAAALLWSSDNQGRIVPVFNPDQGSPLKLKNWPGLLAPYLGWQGAPNATAFPSYSSLPVGICPENPKVFGYGYNYVYLSWIQLPQKNQWVYYAQVTKPSQTVMIVDSVVTAAPTTQWQPYVRVPPSQFYGTGTDVVTAFRHPGGVANVLWLDGHVSAEMSNSPAMTNDAMWQINQ
jgi:prepilin-type processing-associated H-X9-DG protein/prepilin-type N-terminal cleavage/methylation domain-containing protein